MKAALLLCLLAFISCEKDIIDIGKCIYKAPLVKELINDVMIAVVTKDYSKLLPKIKESLPELIQIVLGCINDTKAIEDETKLLTISELMKTQNCDINKLSECYEKCSHCFLTGPKLECFMCAEGCLGQVGC